MHDSQDKTSIGESKKAISATFSLAFILLQITKVKPELTP